MKAKKNDVIQVNEQYPELCGCLMIVNRVRNGIVTAGMRVPYQGTTYFLMTENQFDRIGIAAMIEKED